MGGARAPTGGSITAARVATAARSRDTQNPRSQAASKRSTLDKQGCTDSHCYADQTNDVNSYNSLRTMSTIGFVVGAVGVVGGGVLVLTSPAKKTGSGPRVSPWVGVAAAGVAGRF
jgi:hypothetical protein